MGSLASFIPCTSDEPYLEGKPKSVLTMYPAELTFGNTVIGTDSNESTILLKNDGYDTVAITEIVVVGDFEDTTGALTHVDAGETVALTVRFNPNRAGTITGGIHIQAADASGHKFVKLTGSGVLAPVSLPQFHQLTGVENMPLSAVNIGPGVFAFLGSGSFDGASIQLQWRENTASPWADIPGATLTGANQSIFGIPLTSGQVRVVISGGSAATSVSAKLAW